MLRLIQQANGNYTLEATGIEVVPYASPTPAPTPTPDPVPPPPPTPGTYLLQDGFDEVNMDYSQIAHVTGTAFFEHLAGGGWDGRGCLKFVPPGLDAVNNYYSGLAFYPLPQEVDTLYIRWCLYLGADIPNTTDGSKLIIVGRSGAPGEPPNPRLMCFIHKHQPGVVDMFIGNNVDRAAPYPAQFVIPLQEWISFEWGISLSGNWQRLWVTTRDRRFNDTLVDEIALSRQDGLLSGAEWGYWSPQNPITPDMYYLLDDLIHSQTKIGPPSGF